MEKSMLTSTSRSSRSILSSLIPSSTVSSGSGGSTTRHGPDMVSSASPRRRCVYACVCVCVGLRVRLFGVKRRALASSIARLFARKQARSLSNTPRTHGAYTGRVLAAFALVSSADILTNTAISRQNYDRSLSGFNRQRRE